MATPPAPGRPPLGPIPRTLKIPLPKILSRLSYLTNHAIPDTIDLLAMLAVGDQVEVIAETDGVRQPLQNVNAETLAAPLLRAGSVRRRAAGSDQA